MRLKQRHTFPLAAILICPGWLPAAEADVTAAHQKLAFFEGEWTVEGSEASYRERCTWLEGRLFLVCKAEETTPSGVASSMSVFGYSSEEQAYTYYGFGSSGSVRTLRGWLEGDKWVFTGTRDRGALATRWQIAIRPTQRGFHFRQEKSVNGATWMTDVEVQYLRLGKKSAP